MIRKIKRALELNTKYYLLRRTPIIVLSMERTGSTAMLSSLKRLGELVIGSHYLDPKKLGTRQFSGSARWATKHIIAKRKPAKVIALVRSPIENMLSTFARSDYGKQVVSTSDSENSQVEFSPEQLSEDFRETYLETDRYLWPLGWFDYEFLPTLGIDVFEHPFDQENGFGRIAQDPYDALILRTEMPDEKKVEIVAEFLGLPTFDMTRPAVASENRGRLPSGKPGHLTPYAAKYKALKQGIVIPQKYADAIVDSRHVRHFFTPEEREGLRTQYSGAVTQQS